MLPSLWSGMGWFNLPVWTVGLQPGAQHAAKAEYSVRRYGKHPFTCMVLASSSWQAKIRRWCQRLSDLVTVYTASALDCHLLIF